MNYSHIYQYNEYKRLQNWVSYDIIYASFKIHDNTCLGKQTQLVKVQTMHGNNPQQLQNGNDRERRSMGWAPAVCATLCLFLKKKIQKR